MNLLKGIVVSAVVLIVLIAINMICNMKGVNLDAVVTGTIAAVCAMLVYGGLTKKQNNACENKNNQ